MYVRRRHNPQPQTDLVIMFEFSTSRLLVHEGVAWTAFGSGSCRVPLYLAHSGPASLTFAFFRLGGPARLPT